MMTNTNMSIFNKYTNPETKEVIFKKHIIDKVFWDSIVENTINEGYDKNDKVDIYIPKDVNNFQEYVNYKKYNGSGWTIAKGDFIVRGETQESQVNGIKDLASYETFIITFVDDKDYGSSNMHHINIRGK